MQHEEHAKIARRSGRFGRLRNNFLTGLVVIAPIGLTLWLVWTVTGWIDSWVWPFVPNSLQPEALINRWLGDPDPRSADHITINVRGIGVILFLIFTVIVGWIAKGLIGRSFIAWGEGLVNRMPIVRSVYGGVKQIAETIINQSETNFDTACLVEYPRKGIYAIAFISTNAKGEVKDKLPFENEIVTVFLPTTPNPTSGFLLFLPAEDVMPLDMSVEDAAKLIISAGLVYPGGKADVENAAKAISMASME